MTNNEKNTEMVKTGFAALADTNITLDAEDLEGLQLSFDRIKIPAGGATAFEVPGDNDETEMVKEIECVILHHHPAYAFYQSQYTGGNNPPDCGSFNGITGVGTPGGECANCPFNRFGSGAGQSKACKNRRMIYILVAGELFPMVMSLPTGSLKEFTHYIKRQLSKGRRLSRIVTKISLKKATNSTGITYSQAVFTFVRVLESNEVTAVVPMVEQVKAYAPNLTLAALAQNDDSPMVDPETGEVIEPLK